MEEDPCSQLKALSNRAGDSGLPVVIDEVQRLPELTFALKRIVDQDRLPTCRTARPAMDLIEGKARLSLAQQVNQFNSGKHDVSGDYGFEPRQQSDTAVARPNHNRVTDVRSVQIGTGVGHTARGRDCKILSYPESARINDLLTICRIYR